HGAARLGHRFHQHGVRRCCGRQRERCDGDSRDEPQSLHASVRLPPERSATPASTTPTIPTTSAMIASVELPPPPIDETASSVGAGVSEDSGPDQSTTDPSAYVCRTWNVYVLLEDGDARNENAASSPVGTLPPAQVTFWITAFSPSPVCWSVRFQPDDGTNESIPKPSGTVSSTCVVSLFSF